MLTADPALKPKVAQAWVIGRSENPKNQNINNGECFFLCLGIYGTRKIAASLVLGVFSWVLCPPRG